MGALAAPELSPLAGAATDELVSSTFALTVEGETNGGEGVLHPDGEVTEWGWRRALGVAGSLHQSTSGQNVCLIQEPRYPRLFCFLVARLS